MNHERRSRKPTLHDRLDHLFYLLWRRHEQIKKGFRHMTDATDRLTREVAETKAAILAKLAEMQKVIDDLKANPADEAAVIAAADALDQLQTDLTAAVDTPPAP